ncbi:hypothetical protein B0H14DRAFT_3455043 [Mycena olivaceomarginata]|nr:hypothetical protein B0H14DRAFT_3455043 [Mycena olivaceomarginata]
MPRSAMSQLQSSLLLGSLSLIPNNTLRYTVLALAAGLGVIYAVHLKRPTVQLSKLEETIKETEELIREAKILCPRDLLSLTEAGVRLLEIKRSASMIRCRILETNTFTWKKYCILGRDIADCGMAVRKIRTTVQLIVEAERQRKFTDDINATQTIHAGVGFAGGAIFGYEPFVSQLHERDA